jgi:hypothetical protein
MQENLGQRRSAIRALIVGLVAGLILGFGLVGGGLTPSYGRPSLTDWLVYAVGPIVFSVIGCLVAKHWVIRAILLVEALGTLALTLKLLRFHSVL